MNKYYLPCDKLKSGIQIGQEGSIADLKEKLKNHCFKCSYIISCKFSNEFLKDIVKQQDFNISVLQSETWKF